MLLLGQVVQELPPVVHQTHVHPSDGEQKFSRPNPGEFSFQIVTAESIVQAGYPECCTGSGCYCDTCNASLSGDRH